MRRSVDMEFYNHGSLITLLPLTVRAQTWVEENIGDHTKFCGAVVIEPRYVADIVDGARADGLICAGLARRQCR